jgi:hypothetical protein
MNGTTTSSAERIWDVVVTPFRVTLHLQDGRSVGAPLSWFPRLEGGTDEQRSNWRMGMDGGSVLWPDLNEGLKASDLLRGELHSGNKAVVDG